MMSRQKILLLIASCSLAVVTSAVFAAQASRAPAASVNVPPALTVLQLRPNFYLIAGAGANIGVQIGEDGVVVVDAGLQANAPQVLEAIAKLSPRKIRYVINTGPDPDHVGANEEISRAGVSFVDSTLGSAARRGISADFVSGSSIMAVETVLARMSRDDGNIKAYATNAWPSETFYEPRKAMFLNGEGIEVLRAPNAHTDGDALVRFSRSDVIMAGDVVDIRRFPVIDTARGGTVEGVIDALNRLIGMTYVSVPLVHTDAGTIIVPGHGRVLDQTDLLDYRDTVVIIRDRVQQLIDSGTTLETVLAANPARGFISRYGTDKTWTTKDFVTAVYNSLKDSAE